MKEAGAASCEVKGIVIKRKLRMSKLHGWFGSTSTPPQKANGDLIPAPP